MSAGSIADLPGGQLLRQAPQLLGAGSSFSTQLSAWNERGLEEEGPKGRPTDTPH